MGLESQEAERSPLHQLTYPLILVMLAVGLSLALLPLESIGIGVAALVLIGLAIVDPVFGLYWAVLSIPIQEIVQLPGGTSCTQAAMLLVVFSWGIRVLAHPEQFIAKGRLLPYWMWLLWALLLSTSLTPYSHTEGLKEAFRWGEAFLIWLIVINTVKHPWQIAGLVMCLLLAPAVDAGLGLLQFATGAGPPSFRIGEAQQFVRAYGTFGQPNSFAGYMNMAWPLAFALAVVATMAQLRAHKWSVRSWGALALIWAVVGVLVAALGASFSRGAWLGAMIGLLGMIALLGRQMAQWMIAVLLAGVLLVVIGRPWLPPALTARVASITRSISLFDASAVEVTPENFAVVERMAHIQAGWRMFEAYPLTGIGPGNYSIAYNDFAIGSWFVSRGHAHNYYLHIAAETGLIGLLAYLALIGSAGYLVIQARRHAQGIWQRSLLIGCGGIVAAVAGHNLFENLHVLSMGIHIAAVWGLLDLPYWDVAAPMYSDTERAA